MDEQIIEDAARRLLAGDIVGFPTETVYGLGADATNASAVAAIYAAKGRPRFNPLIAHVATRAAAEREAFVSPRAAALMATFWPGPLTLVLRRRPGGSVCDLACAGLETIAIRMPDHAFALAMIRAVGRPVVAPSANRSGSVSPTTAAHVRDDLGSRVSLVVDGGPCPVGVESTIVQCDGDRLLLLRPGGLAREAIEAAAGSSLEAPNGKIVAPGMLSSHYAPAAALRLGALELRSGETGLDFGGRFGPFAAADLSPAGDLVEAAANLYACLRRLDAAGATVIAVAPLPRTGLGEAIDDRLRRAAAPRPSA